MRAPLRLLCLIFAACALWQRVQGAESSLSAGAASVEITPSTNMLNWVTGKPYTGVLDPIYVRALTLSDGKTRGAILTWDLVDTREGVVAKIRQEIEAAVGIPATNILINASHSHSAPFAPTLGDPLIAIDRKVIEPVERDPLHREWTTNLIVRCVEAIRTAEASRRTAKLGISRAWAGEVLFNRRPVKEEGKVETTFQPANPYSLPHGERFGPMDPTLTLLSFRDEKGATLASVFSLPCHAVCIYGSNQGISGDWPGAVASRLRQSFGGEALFLQGCAGDIVPARRGLPQRLDMAELVSHRTVMAQTNSHALPNGKLRVSRRVVTLPLTPSATHDIGLSNMTSEVQVLSFGTLAIVALPGEPLTGISLEIQKRSPFPHTLVIGYSNGNGVEYVGLPGEKIRGGYEMGESGEGDDRCGQILIDAAESLLKEGANR
ncbi:MAG TPA: hypothetical protein VMF06_16220 [Candidatus Limnocylindria bacterium]|nr:hypothetical protein [Candidatus Limnocylindria bacterium]